MPKHQTNANWYFKFPIVNTKPDSSVWLGNNVNWGFPWASQGANYTHLQHFLNFFVYFFLDFGLDFGPGPEQQLTSINIYGWLHALAKFGLPENAIESSINKFLTGSFCDSVNSSEIDTSSQVSI